MHGKRRKPTTGCKKPVGKITEFVPSDTVFDCESVRKCETVTAIVLDGAGGFTYTNEAGIGVAVSLCDLVGEIPNLAANTATGDLVLVKNTDGSCELKQLNYTVDINVENLTYDPVTQNIILTETDGEVHQINLTDLVDIETITTLVNNNDGTFTYTNEAGVAVIIPVNNSNVVPVVTGQEIAIHDDGNGNVVSIQESVTTLVLNADGTHTYTAENGTQTVLPAEIVTAITATILGNQIAIYTNESGVAVPINETVTTLVLNADGTYTYTSETGVVTILPAEIITTITATIEGNQIAIYTNENGVPVVINETITTLILNADGTYTHTSEDGTQTVLPAEILTTIANTIAGHQIATYTNEDGVVVPVNETITTLTYDPITGTYTFTHEDGTTSIIDPCQAIEDTQPPFDCSYFTGAGVPAKRVAAAPTIPIAPADGSNFSGRGNPSILGIAGTKNGQIYTDLDTTINYAWSATFSQWQEQRRRKKTTK